MNQFSEQAQILSILITLASGFSIFRCFKYDRLLTCLGGFHVNQFFMYGIGPSAYIFNPIGSERLSHDIVTHQISVNAVPVLLGYLLWILIEPFFIRPMPENLRSNNVPLSTIGMMICFGLALTGYFLSQFELSNYGFGTIFYVLKHLIYPLLVITILTLDLKQNLQSIIIKLSFISILLYMSFFSVWRSELILFGTYVTIAMIYRFPRHIIWILVLMSLGIIVILPFNISKRANYDQFKEDPFEMLSQSLSIPVSERLNMCMIFAGERMNSMREMGYITAAIESNVIPYRYGLSYYEALLQTIPRPLWPDKPLFNAYLNRIVAREVGLVGWEDAGTSWGVSLLCEFSLNFNVWWYLLFIPLLFGFMNLVDRLVTYVFQRNDIKKITFMTLFYIGFSGLTLLSLTSSLIWLFIVFKFIEMLLNFLEHRN